MELLATALPITASVSTGTSLRRRLCSKLAAFGMVFFLDCAFHLPRMALNKNCMQAKLKVGRFEMLLEGFCCILSAT